MFWKKKNSKGKYVVLIESTLKKNMNTEESSQT